MCRAVHATQLRSVSMCMAVFDQSTRLTCIAHMAGLSFHIRGVCIVLGASFCLTQGRSWSVCEGSSFCYPDPAANADLCKSAAFGTNRICDPEQLLERDEDTVKRINVAFAALERELGSGTAWDINVGVAVLAGSAPDFAANLASAWNMSGEDNALLVLSTESSGLAGSVVAGGLLVSVGQRAWQAALELRVAALLRTGKIVDALEAGLSGLAELLGGSPLCALPSPFSVSLPGVQSSAVKTKTLKEKKTKFQRLDLQTNTCGQERCKQLFLDDILQLSDRFEPYYHEAMSLPALNALGPKDARRVLILGGGDCGIASMALEFDSVEKVVLVDIDKEVTAVSKQHFPAVSAALEDKRFTAIFGDALKYVADHQDDEFDLVIIDFSDTPIDGFWTKAFFEQVKNLLSPRGALVQNIGTVLKGLPELFTFHSQVFKSVWPYSMVAPDYFSPYVLVLSSDALSPLEVDWPFWEKQNITTHYYSPSLHSRLFAVTADVLHILGAKVPGSPTCPAPLPEEREANHPLDVDELETDDSDELFAVQTDYQYVRVLEHDFTNSTAKFFPWGRESFACSDAPAESKGPNGCFRSLRAGREKSRLTDLLGPVAATFNENVVLPAMNILGKKARRVLLLGGGDGVMASLILKYAHVEHLTVVEIDAKVLEALDKWFPLQGAALRDKRTRVITQDAMQFLDGLEEKFDAIFVNLAHNAWQKATRITRVPLSTGFVRQLKGLLSPDGVVVQDMGSIAAPRLALRRFMMHRSVFEHTWPLNFATLADTYSAENDRQWRHSPRLLVLSSRVFLDPLAVDWSVWQKAEIATLSYHASTHHSLFVLPAELQRLFQSPPPPSSKPLCEDPSRLYLYQLSSKLLPRQTATVNHFIFDLKGCTQLSAGFIDHVKSRFVSFPSYGSWLHKLDEQNRLAMLLIDGAFVSFQYNKGSRQATVTLGCHEESCAGLQQRLAKAVDQKLGCAATSSWRPFSPAISQDAESRPEL